MLTNHIPFPPIPDTLSERFCAKGLRLSGLEATKSYLDLDFSSTHRCRVVQAILEACACNPAAKVNPEFLWNLTLGTRLGCLLRIALVDELTLPLLRLRCRVNGCNADLECELSLHHVVESHSDRATPESVRVNFPRASAQLRVPTGADQRDWTEQKRRGLAPSAKRIVSDLLLEAEGVRRLTTKRLALIEESLAQADPLVNFDLRVSCPDCRQEAKFPVDLEELILSAFHRRQRTVIEDVHRLAASYHWPERDIMQLPVWRRSAYLALVSATTTP